MRRFTQKALLGLCFIITSHMTWSQDISLSLGANSSLNLVENCGVDTSILLVESLDLAMATDLLLSLSGSATEDQDFTMVVPEPFNINGSQTLEILLILTSDDVIEGTESLTINLQQVGSTNSLGQLSFTLQDQLSLEIAESDPIEVCQDEAIALSSSDAGPVISWSYGEEEAVADSVLFKATQSGLVRASRTLGTCSVEDQVQVSLTASARIEQGDTLFVCFPNPGQLTVNTSGEPGTITWSGVDSTLSSLEGNSTTVTTAVTETYIMNFESASCLISDTVVVRIDSLPTEMPITVVPEKEDYCPGEIVTLFSRYLGPIDFPDAEYEWMYDAGSPLSAETLENFVFSTVDTSVFRRTTTNNACMVTDTVKLIVINPPVELNLTDTSVCPNQPVQIILETADQLDEFEWMPTEGLDRPMQPDPIATVPMTTTYTVMGMLKGCPASASVNINIIPPQPLTVAPDTIVCPGDPVQLTVVNPGNFGDFQWSGENLSCNDCPNPVASPDRGSTYLVTGEDPMGCLAAGGVTISTFGLATPALTANPMGDIAQGATVTLTTEGGGQSYTWTRNGTSISGNSESITAEVLEENNLFRVEIINELGCLVSAEITIIGVPPSFDIPNAFTPNADELNDRFRVIIMGAIELLDFKIFNRWGQIVYNDTAEMGWDGRINGDNAPSEVYAYTATLRFPDGRTEEARGEVMLIR